MRAVAGGGRAGFAHQGQEYRVVCFGANFRSATYLRALTANIAGKLLDACANPGFEGGVFGDHPSWTFSNNALIFMEMIVFGMVVYGIVII